MKRYFHLILSAIFVLAVFASVFAANGLFPFGDKSLSWCDMNQQVIPLLCDFKDILAGKDGFFLSLSNAGGMNFYGVFFFFLASPFSFLVAFVSKADIPFLMNILVVLKLCTCAICAGIYFEKRFCSLSPFLKAALSTSYALCGYGMLFYQNIIWLDIMYLFPLLLLGIELLSDEGKPLLFTLSLGATVIVNYYISYMVILFALLYFGFYALFFKRADLTVFVRLGISTVCALLFGALVWLPSLLQYFSSGRTSNVIQGLKDSAFFAYTETSLPVLLCTGIILAVLLLILPRFYEQSVKMKMLACVFLLMCVPVFTEPVNRMWHTGNYMSFPVRYGFITVFMGLVICAEYLSGKEFASRTRPIFGVPVIALCTGTALFMLSYAYKNCDTLSHYVQTLWGDKASLQGLLILFLCAVGIYIAVIALASCKKIGQSILALCLCIAVLAEGLCAVTVYVGTAKDKLDTNNFAKFIALEDTVDDTGLYRVNMSSKISDANMTGAAGFNSLGHYTSLTHSNYMKAAKQFGLSGYWMEIGNWGGSILSDALLNVEYEISRDGFDYKVNKTSGAAGFGIASAKKLPEELPDGNRLYVLGKYFADIFALDSNPVTQYDIAYTAGCEHFKRDGQNYFVSLKNDNSIVYNLRADGEKMLYFDCYNGAFNALTEPINGAFDVYVNGSLFSRDYPTQSYNAPLELGSFKDEQVTVLLKLKKDINCFSFGVFGVDSDAVSTAVSTAKIPVFTQEGSTITAELRADNLGEMFLSLPYNEGYRITLNGKEIPYSRCMTGFMSISPDKAGSLKITFVPKGFYLGLALSVAGVALLIGFLMLNKKLHLLPAPLKKLTFGLFIFIFAVFLLAIYIMPVIINLLF